MMVVFESSYFVSVVIIIVLMGVALLDEVGVASAGMVLVVVAVVAVVDVEVVDEVIIPVKEYQS